MAAPVAGGGGTPVWVWVVGGVGGYFALRYVYTNYFSGDDGAPPPPVTFEQFSKDVLTPVNSALAQSGALIRQQITRDFNARAGFIPNFGSAITRYPPGWKGDDVDASVDADISRQLQMAAGGAYPKAAACARAQGHLLNTPSHKDDASSPIQQWYRQVCGALVPEQPATQPLLDPDSNEARMQASQNTANDIIAKYRASHPTTPMQTLGDANSKLAGIFAGRVQS